MLEGYWKNLKSGKARRAVAGDTDVIMKKSSPAKKIGGASRGGSKKRKERETDVLTGDFLISEGK